MARVSLIEEKDHPELASNEFNDLIVGLARALSS
jgi:hypothetical protein